LARNIKAEGQMLLVIATGVLLFLALMLAAMSVWSLRKPARS